MKKNSLGGIVILICLALATIWFNQGNGGQTEQNLTGQQNSGDYLLVVSWQPAFCEQRPNKPECRSQRSGRPDAENFSLHGLWPQPAGTAYCGVPPDLVSVDKSGRWRDLPKLDLSDALRNELSEKMPGYRSYLHRHEWFKHGTCIPGFSPQVYYQVSLRMLDQLNSNAVRKLFAENVGGRLRFSDVRNAMQRAFGKAAGERFIMDCHRDDGRRIIHELKLSLSGELDLAPTLDDLMSGGRKMRKSCPSGIVDPVGLQ